VPAQSLGALVDAAGDLLCLGVNLLPGRLAETGALLPLMRFTSRVTAKVGMRDRVENAAVKCITHWPCGVRRSGGGRAAAADSAVSLRADRSTGVLAMAGRYASPSSLRRADNWRDA